MTGLGAHQRLLPGTWRHVAQVTDKASIAEAAERGDSAEAGLVFFGKSIKETVRRHWQH